MNKKYSSTVVLSETDKDAIIQTINQAEKLIPGLVSASASKRRRMSHLGIKSRGFMEKAIHLGVSNPGMLPRSMDPAQLAAGADTYSHLENIRQLCSKLHEKVANTLSLLGAELYQDARTIYNLAKKESLADGIHDSTLELAKRFTGQGAKKKQATVESTTEMEG